MQRFDLTTQSGLRQVQNYLYPSSPILMIGKWLIDKIFTTPEEQGRVVKDLIEKGRQNGVNEMEIELIDKGGINLNLPVDEYKIDTHVGKDQKMRISVKYK